jgi:hypothetical protein
MSAITSLDSQQSTATEDTEAKLLQILNYCATHPIATIRYQASEMILNIHSDARYLNKPEARSRSGGAFFHEFNTKEWGETSKWCTAYLITNPPHGGC